jgi:hypothetical protein
MVERIIEGKVTPCEMQDIKRGDCFRTIDGAGIGPWLTALADARQEPDWRTKHLVWYVSSTFASHY